MPNTRVPVRLLVIIQSIVIPPLLVINSTCRFSTTGSAADGHTAGFVVGCSLSVSVPLLRPILLSYDSSLQANERIYLHQGESWWLFLKGNFFKKLRSYHLCLSLPPHSVQLESKLSHEFNRSWWCCLAPPPIFLWSPLSSRLQYTADLCVNVRAPFTWPSFVSPCAFLHKNP